MLFFSCNSSRPSKDMASLGFTSVSSPWEVVYYFQPGITGQSQGSSLGSRITGICQNTTSVLGRAAAGCCPGDVGMMGVRWPWGSGMLHSLGDAAVGCRMLLSCGAGTAPGTVSSAHGSSQGGRETVRPFSRARCVGAYIWMLRLF